MKKTISVGAGLASPRHHRRSMRLQRYDYSQAGAYFMTLCVRNHESLFGEVVGEEMVLNATGHTVRSVWDGLPQRFPTIEPDAFVVMPNHVHGIIIIVGAGLALPRGASPPGGAASGAPTFPDVVRAFKSLSAIAGSRNLGGTRRSLWQRNYYKHIIRDEESLASIRQYIADNPLGWALDRENPANL